MELPSTQKTSASSSLICKGKYDVFLSFRGEDTRMKFTDHLYAALTRNGIYTFKDGPKLERGKTMKPELLKAIEESRFSIIILSERYPSSTWCLDELVKIIDCKNKLGQIVVPVFYDVDPSEIRNLKGHFHEAFVDHEKAYGDNLEKVQKWRAAMTEVANLRGFHSKNRHESKLIQDIVKEISSKLNTTLSSVLKEFVGLDLRLDKLSSHIDLGLDDVRLIGICGMGGIGKTTLARVAYNQMSCHFEGSSFLGNVREVSQEGHLVSLQEKLLSQILMESSFRIWDVQDGINMIRSRLRNKRVLVIIDDVDHIDQLKKLAGNHDWFGLGSRIIITTRDKHLLIAHRVNIVYKVEGLGHTEALQLFSLKAFKNDHPPTDYVELSRNVVKYADGLPLALKVFGSFLSGRSVDVWKSALERLKEDSGKEILDRLQISFDGLEEIEKKIFLDIACFFKGKDNDYVTKILDSFYPQIGIQILVEKCLITISSNNELWMHDLVQEMAKKIVWKESAKELGKRSRLWDKEEVYHVLTNNMGTEAVEGITQNFSEQEEVNLSAKAFSTMNKLRVLQICNVQLPQGLDYLSNELQFLEWDGYPLKSLPSSFHLDKVVVLNLFNSRIQQLWKGIKLLNKLKFINLSHSQNLTKIPDFTGVPNLESLILEGCTRLSEVHPSIGVLKRLILLNLKDCKSLSNLPSFIKLESLEECLLAGCSKLKKFPEIIGKMDFLKNLDVSGTAIGQFPSSTFLSMKNLEVLSFCGCKGPSYKSWHLLSPFRIMQRRGLDSIPLMLPSLSGLCSLTDLDLSDCNLREGAIPNDFGCLSSLKILNLSSNNFVSLPASINQLSNLNVLYLNNCKKLQSLLELPSNIVSVWAEACSSLKALPYPFDWGFYGFRCFQLLENQGYNSMAFARIKGYLQGLSNQSNPLKKDRFDIVLPGGEIPEWFSYQSEEPSVSIKRVPLLHSSKNSKLMGFALCSVFLVHEHRLVLDDSHHTSYTLGLGCSGKANDTYFPIHPAFAFDDKSGEAVSDHLWLLYLCRHSKYFDMKGKDYSDIKFTFYSSGGQCVEVKKCGIRPVYKHDVEEFNQKTDFKCTNSLFEKVNDLHQDFDRSTMNGAMIKQIHDDCDGTELTESGSFVDKPQPKRLKITPNFFDGGIPHWHQPPR